MENLFILTKDNGRSLVLISLFLLLLWESGAPYFLFFKALEKKRSLHALKNISLGVINASVLSIFFISLWSAATQFSQDNQFGIFYFLNISNYSYSTGLHAFLSVILLDIWTYAWHRMNHKIPFLWRFHKVHHSDTQMDVTTSFRFHFGEIILSSILRTFILILIGAELWHVALYESIMFPIVQFHHANIGLPNSLDSFLRIFIATPEMHKIHHSNYQPETDSNYTSLLSVWDRLFGSYKTKKDLKNISFGIDKAQSTRNFIQLIKDPLKK